MYETRKKHQYDDIFRPDGTTGRNQDIEEQDDDYMGFDNQKNKNCV